MEQLQANPFLLTFFGYFIAHSLRTSWSYSKTNLQTTAAISITKQQQGIVDVVFLLCYAFGSSLLGPIGDRISKRKFLVLGYVIAGITFFLIGIIYKLSGMKNIILMVIFMGINGIGQSVGLPGSMSLLSKYYDRKQQGLAIALWPSCANLGNIFGLLSSTIIIRYLNLSWQFAYIFNSILLLAMTLIIYINLNYAQSTLQPILQPQEQLPLEQGPQQTQVTFFSAFYLPRVLEYTIASCCVKGSIYGLLFWLPKYLNQKGMMESSGFIASTQQIGAILGAFLIGYLSKKYLVSFFLAPCFYVSSVLMIVPKFFVDTSVIPYYFVMFFLGITLGGSYNIISSSICIDLGTQKSIKSNTKATSTVTGLIQGIASLFAAATQLILAQSSSKLIFTLLAVYCLIAAVTLSPIFYRDVSFYFNKKAQTIEQ